MFWTKTIYKYPYFGSFSLSQVRVHSHFLTHMKRLLLHCSLSIYFTVINDEWTENCRFSSNYLLHAFSVVCMMHVFFLYHCLRYALYTKERRMYWSIVRKWVWFTDLLFHALWMVCSTGKKRGLNCKRSRANTWRRIEQGKSPAAPSSLSAFFQG